jgi:hypothetical protein
MLTKEEIQSSYDKEIESIRTQTARISELCKYSWAGALAIFFSLVVAAKDSEAARFTHGIRFLWLAAIAGAIAFIFEFLQFIFAYIHSRRFADWLGEQRQVSKPQHDAQTTSFLVTLNLAFFRLKIVASLLAAALVALGILAASKSFTGY